MPRGSGTPTGAPVRPAASGSCPLRARPVPSRAVVVPRRGRCIWHGPRCEGRCRDSCAARVPPPRRPRRRAGRFRSACPRTTGSGPWSAGRGPSGVHIASETRTAPPGPSKTRRPGSGGLWAGSPLRAESVRLCACFWYRVSSAWASARTLAMLSASVWRSVNSLAVLRTKSLVTLALAPFQRAVSDFFVKPSRTSVVSLARSPAIVLQSDAAVPSLVRSSAMRSEYEKSPIPPLPT